MRNTFSVAVGILLVLFFSNLAQGQTNLAGVTGIVEDPSGASVVGAQVKVLNLETGQELTATTNSDGSFTIPSVLPPGTYKVEASHTGFKTTVSEAFVLQIGEVKSVRIALQLGQGKEQITVTAAAALLQTETSSTGSVITGREIVDIPLNQRNFTELAILTPGVTRSFVGPLVDQTLFNQGDPNAGSVPGLGDPRGDTPAARFGRSGGASLAVNGLRPSNNNFTLDGVDNNEPQYQSIGVFPNPDAIEEFRVETTLSKAEVGRGGASVNTVFKSGTNDVHGDVFYFGQNDALNATPWLINRDRAANPLLKKSTIHVNEFGFTLGSPVIKNRMFIFGDYLGQRNSVPNFFESTVPTAKTRNGDFSEFVATNGSILPVIDPSTCTKPGDVSSGGCSTFPGGVITNLQSRPDFSAPAFKLLNLFPLPTKNITNPSNGNQNFFGTRANRETINNYDVKVDQRLSDKNSLSGRFSYQNLSRVRANFFPKLPTAGFGSGNEIGNSRQVAVSDTHIFRPTLLNEARFGWTRVDIGILNCGVEGACGVSPTFCNDIGIPNCNKGTQGTSGGLLTGGFGTGEFEFTGDGGLFIAKSNGFYAADNVTIISGKHSWKTGIEVRPRHLDTLCGGCAGFLKGHLQFPAAGPQTTGNVQADYLLSRPAVQAFSGTILGGDKPFELRETEWAFFVQDDWKATPNLTLNIGLRYELFPGFHEVNGRLANFDVTTSSIIKATGGGDSLTNTDKTDLGPRVGFAYSFGPQNHLVLRGGYGLFYTRDTMDIPPLTRNPPLTNTVTFSAFSGNQGNFNLTTGPPVAPVTDPPVITPNLSFFEVPFSQKSPQISEWNLTLGWQFAREWLLDIGYVGNRAHHLLATRELGNNQNGLGLARTPAGQPIGSVQAFENRASSQYDGFQTRLEKHFSRGFLLGANYTWSHAIDDSTGVFQSAGEVRGAAGGPANPFNFRLDRGNSSSDRTHIFTSDLVWDLPFGHGKKYGGSVNSILDKFIGGWQSNFIWSGQSGQPFTVAASSPIGNTRADLLCNPFASPPPDRFINVLCFGPPSQSVINLAGKQVFFGNVGRNAFRGPGFFRTDFSMFKNTSITERINMQVGIEMFNTFNQTNHIVPNNTINNFSDPACFPQPTANCGFGRFDNALPPRTFQYRMKFIF